MVSLIRSGPKTLIFESSYINELKEYLTTELNGTEYDLDTGLKEAGEEHTILFLTEEIKNIVGREDIQAVLVLKKEPDVIMCHMISSDKMRLIRKARTAPRIIFLHAIGDMEKVVAEINKDYTCITGKFMDIFSSHNEKGTIINLTDKPLHKNVNLKDIYEKSIYIEKDFYSLFRNMRMNGLKYLNAGIGNKDWYEIEIRVFDLFSEYKLHYARLADILDYLQLGLILGESWGKDYPMVLMSVDVYRVRFFTFYEPKYIKKILLGMEHLDDGTRIVDYDVYFNRKKIYWTEANDHKMRNRESISKKYRNEIFSKLSESETKKILELEGQILKTRY